MANRFAGLDPTWAHLPTPAPTHAAASHCCSFPAAAFENKALTSALRASMAPAAPAHAYAYAAAAAAAAASPFSSPATPSSSTTSSASELLSSGHDAPAPSSGPAGRPPARALKGPKAGRVNKRKPRPSRRPQTTYITADPANFRRMVQEVTGLPARVLAGPPSSAAPERTAAVAAPSWTPAPSFVLPTLDTSAFLLDRAAPAPEVKSSSRGYAPAATAPTAAAAGNDDPSALLVQMEAMIDFPTLESWGII